MTDLYQHRTDLTLHIIAVNARRIRIYQPYPGTIVGSVLGITRPNFGITRADMTKITTKGQVTIPKRLRDYLGLKPGSSVDFELSQDGRVFLKTHHEAPESRFARLRGSAKPGMTTDELMALTRGEDTD